MLSFYMYQFSAVFFLTLFTPDWWSSSWEPSSSFHIPLLSSSTVFWVMNTVHFTEGLVGVKNRKHVVVCNLLSPGFVELRELVDLHSKPTHDAEDEDPLTYDEALIIKVCQLYYRVYYKWTRECLRNVYIATFINGLCLLDLNILCNLGVCFSAILTKPWCSTIFCQNGALHPLATIL